MNLHPATQPPLTRRVPEQDIDPPMSTGLSLYLLQFAQKPPLEHSYAFHTLRDSQLKS
jgi:hypothetical protein